MWAVAGSALRTHIRGSGRVIAAGTSAAFAVAAAAAAAAAATGAAAAAAADGGAAALSAAAAAVAGAGGGGGGGIAWLRSLPPLLQLVGRHTVGGSAERGWWPGGAPLARPWLSPAVCLRRPPRVGSLSLVSPPPPPPPGLLLLLSRFLRLLLLLLVLVPVLLWLLWLLLLAFFARLFTQGSSTLLPFQGGERVRHDRCWSQAMGGGGSGVAGSLLLRWYRCGRC